MAKKQALCLGLFFLLLYGASQSTSIYGGDAGDLVSAAYVHGVAHPPGYPVYTFLGWLLTKLPLGTVAWRVGFLSSIPAAASLVIFFLILARISKNRVVALITTCSFGLTYLYWLYAIVAEVFALHLLLVVVILFLALRFRDQPKPIFLYLLSFIFGLALSHHQTILFIVPAYLFVIYPRLFVLKRKIGIFFSCLLLMIVGFTPYLYVIWAAHTNPAVNWENPQTLSGFIRLLSRAVYGTFRSGNFILPGPLDRYYQLRNMLETIFLDFTRLGVALFVIGAVTHFKKDRQMFLRFGLFLLLAGPLFIFYAGFPVVLNFYLAVSERFLLVPYLFLYIWVGIGIARVSSWLDLFFARFAPHRFKLSAVYVFFLLPLSLLFINSAKLLPLKDDRTPELLAEDILRSAPANSILFLMDDTSFFNSQYLYLTRGGEQAWRGIKLFQFGTLGFDYYKHLIRTQYPTINVNTWGKPAEIFQVLVSEYYGKMPIVSSVAVDLGKEYVWVQMGLLKRLYKKSDLALIRLDDYMQENIALFASYQDPLAGALGKYMHVMLADVVRIYSNARSDMGDRLLQAGQGQQAEVFFREARRLQPEVLAPGIKLAHSLVLEQKCQEAEAVLLDLEHRFSDDSRPKQMLASLYRECFNDEEKAKGFEAKYKQLQERFKSDLIDF